MKKAVKKTKKVSSQKSSVKKTSAAKQKLIKKLNELAKALPDKGVSILVQQAEVMIHNINVEKDYIESQKKRTAINKKKALKQELITVQETADNSMFGLTLNGENKTFLLSEMKELVRICHSTDDESEGAGLLYRWMNRKRKDVLLDVYIDSPYHFILKELYKFLKNRYTTK